MGIIIRGMANVLRNPVRLILVVVLLGASLMFVAAMISLNNSAQQEIASVHQQVGTSITINYAENNAGQFGGTFGGNGANGGAGGTGGIVLEVLEVRQEAEVAGLPVRPGTSAGSQTLRRRQFQPQ